MNIGYRSIFKIGTHYWTMIYTRTYREAPGYDMVLNAATNKPDRGETPMRIGSAPVLVYLMIAT